MTENFTENASLLNFREKRKWQIALRRYVIEGQMCSFYAPYFGLDIPRYRNWLELQFEGDISWDNFGKMWQLDHIIPVGYFDFGKEEDLKLCWNFVNIRVEKAHQNKNRGNRVDVLTAKTYFQELFDKTGLLVCRDMIRKIDEIEISQIASTTKMESFILDNVQFLADVTDFTSYEFDQLNMGVPIEDVKAERALVRKYSS